MFTKLVNLEGAILCRDSWDDFLFYKNGYITILYNVYYTAEYSNIDGMTKWPISSDDIMAAFETEYQSYMDERNGMPNGAEVYEDYSVKDLVRLFRQAAQEDYKDNLIEQNIIVYWIAKKAGALDTIKGKNYIDRDTISDLERKTGCILNA